jgi:uncharacterized surface protein with fasciclin (FAS1) repeats
MKTKLSLIGLVLMTYIFQSCEPAVKEQPAGETTAAVMDVGQANVVDDVSQKDIVKVAIGSKDHSTLVAAVKAADLVNALSNAGPFTVFAPVNAAFDQLPAGTVDELLKAENKDKLADILQYHVTVSVYEAERLTDGLTLGQVNGGNVKITNKDGKVMVNDATIIASVKATNGVIHVIDKVLLPK